MVIGGLGFQAAVVSLRMYIYKEVVLKDIQFN